MTLMDDINGLPTSLEENATNHLHHHQVIHEALQDHIGNTASTVNPTSEHARKLVRLDDEGKLYVFNDSITRDGDLVNKSYVDTRIINNTSSYVGDGNSDAFKIVRLDAEGKLSVRTDLISRRGDVVNKDYVDTKVAESGGGGLAHQGRGRPAPATPYLNIPTPDGLPSVGHPDVIVIEGGWNGYEYWMAYTPYPDEPRENPNIACSHDGVNWEVPPGLINPIAPFSEAGALGYDYWSDTDLVHLPDGRLACYFRGAVQNVKDVLVRKVSSDGVNWGQLEVVAELGFTTAMSPAIVVEADSTFSMWSINFTRPPAERLERRTSTDGVNWSGPVSCTIPGSALGYTWHVDVIRVGDLYHALVATREGYGLYYRWSRDGITWEGPADYIPRTGYAFDQDGHYRSTMVALPGGKFDIWLTGINAPNGDVFETAQWRVGLLRDVDLRAVTPAGPGGGSVDSVWAWSRELVTTYGNPTQEFVGDVTPAIGFAENAITSAAVIFPPPPTDWNSFAVDVMCTAPTGGADVLISTRHIPMGEGVQLTPGGEVMATVSIPSGNNVTRVFQVRTVTNQPPRDRGVRVTIARVGVDPADTLEEQFLILGLRLRKLS